MAPPFRKSFHWILFISSVALFYFAALMLWHPEGQHQLSKDGSSSRKVLILAATPFFGSPITDSVLRKCPVHVKNFCHVTNNPNDFRNADAVIFHSRDFDEAKMHRFMAKFKRKPEIPYVMMILESPFHAHLHPYKDFFNWTMSYRRTSEAPFPYGGLIQHREKVKIDYDAIWSSKSKTALWLVSNNLKTGNRRKELVEKMVKEGLEVDLLGELYKVPTGCPRNGGGDECEEKLHRPYKFTIAFENNNCEDYVTEKFWRKTARFGTVPIVMKRKIYKDLGIPDSMYISVDDHPNLRDFVAHVKRVSSNKTAYSEYHKWREDFRIVDTNEGYCHLCLKLLHFHGEPTNSYESLSEWHNASSSCDNSFAHRYL